VWKFLGAGHQSRPPGCSDIDEFNLCIGLYPVRAILSVFSNILLDIASVLLTARLPNKIFMLFTFFLPILSSLKIIYLLISGFFSLSYVVFS